MQYCSKCGQPVDGQFCSHCGMPASQPGQGNSWGSGPNIPQPKKKNTGLIVGLCLGIVAVIAAVVVVLVLVLTASNPAPEGGKVDPTDAPVATEGKKPTEAPETKPTDAPETKPTEAPETEPTESEPSEGAPLPYSADSYVVVGDRLYFVEDDGIYCFVEDEKFCVCSGSFQQSSSIATNGEDLYAVVNQNSLVCVDLSSGEMEPVFTIADAYSVTVCGATGDTLYLGTQASADEWFGYTLTAYDPSGNPLESYGSYLQAVMVEGVLMISNFRSDVSPMTLQVLDTNTGETLLNLQDDDRSWGHEYINGSLYYVQASLEDSIGSGGPLELKRIGADGPQTLQNVTGSMASLYDGVFYVFDPSGSSPRQAFSATTGEPISCDLPGGLSDNDTLGYDTDGYLYVVRDGVLYRENDDGVLAESCTTDEGYLTFVIGDYAYFTRYDGSSRSLSAVYAPATFG